MNEVVSSARTSPVYTGVIVAFVVYSAVIALQKREYTGAFGLLQLFVDTVLFLILANHGAGHSLWFSSIFFLYLLSGAVVLYSPREVFVVVGICLAFSFVSQQTYIPLLRRTIVVAGAIACAFSVTKIRLNDRIRELTRIASDAQVQAEKAREEERQRIASDFHDGPLQSFISLQMRLQIVRRLLERDHDAGVNELHQLQELAQTQVRDLRTFVRSMRPVDLDGANLAASARRIAESFQKESGIPVTFVGGDANLSLPPEACSELLQMLREALHNVQKHAGATRVAVALEKTDKVLEVSVDDNGRGFFFSGTYTLDELEVLRLGPASLKRRARSLNADLILESRPGRGAGLKVRIPA